ncbi:alpha/beta fold hydrolase [Nonomuraea sp. NPDC049758]|uniref:thioesterase II family protein n=1 Tax=Nonomuraea sp. NPDC049758 TaxID=3154360 RepID=UPI0034147D1E
MTYTTFGRPLTRPHRLICFPYAGGAASDYRDWAGRLPGVDVVAACLPGRAGRYQERATTAFAPLLEELAAGIEPYLGARVTLFGHSMGGLLAFEVARRLEAQGRPVALVIASGTEAPGTIAALPPYEDVPDETLLAELADDGVVPAEALGNDELMSLMLPVLRADYEVIADYRHHPAGPPLSTPMLVYYGIDEVPDPDRLRRQWAAAVAGPLGLRGFPGGHFFVHDAREHVIARLVEDVDGTVAA